MLSCRARSLCLLKKQLMLKLSSQYTTVQPHNEVNYYGREQSINRIISTSVGRDARTCERDYLFKMIGDKREDPSERVQMRKRTWKRTKLNS